MSEQLRAISLWQPWASLWLTDAKVYETRHWPTQHRGTLYVHAARRAVRPTEISAALNLICIAELGRDYETSLPLGAIIGVVNIAACLPTGERVFYVSDRERACGNWNIGRWAWMRSSAAHVGPWKYKGKQGIFRCDDLDAVANARIEGAPR